MSVSLLTSLLWIPFGIVVIIVGAIFLTSGYKRGLWRALISTGATVAATLISMLIANLLSKPIANVVLGALPPMTEADGSLTPEIMTNLIKGVVGVVLSLILFSILLFVFSIILKCVTNRIKNEKLNVDKKSLKWAGLGVRVVDTVLFAMLLLLPLYGTIATYAPAAQTVLQMQDRQDGEVEAYLEAMTAHPVVKMSGNGPAAWVYTGLSDMQLGESSVNVADMAQSVNGLITRAEALSVASADQLPALVRDLVQYTRENVIEQPWCYDLVQETLEMLEQSLRQDIAQEDQAQVDAFLKLSEMSRDEFKENGIQMLDLVNYLLEGGAMENEEKAQQILKSEAFLSRLGAFLNCTDQAVAAKNLMIQMTIQEDLFLGDAQAANAFLEGRLSAEPTEQARQVEEAAAFLLLMEASSRKERVNALNQLPSFDFDEEDAGLLPLPSDPFEGIMNEGTFISGGEGGTVTGIIRDENGNMVVVDGEGNPTGTIVWDGGEVEGSTEPTYTIIYRGE